MCWVKLDFWNSKTLLGWDVWQCTSNALFERTRYEPGLEIEMNGPGKYVVREREGSGGDMRNGHRNVNLYQ